MKTNGGKLTAATGFFFAGFAASPADLVIAAGTALAMRAGPAPGAGWVAPLAGASGPAGDADVDADTAAAVDADDADVGDDDVIDGEALGVTTESDADGFDVVDGTGVASPPDGGATRADVDAAIVAAGAEPDRLIATMARMTTPIATTPRSVPAIAKWFF